MRSLVIYLCGVVLAICAGISVEIHTYGLAAEMAILALGALVDSSLMRNR